MKVEVLDYETEELVEEFTFEEKSVKETFEFEYLKDFKVRLSYVNDQGEEEIYKVMEI